MTIQDAILERGEADYRGWTIRPAREARNRPRFAVTCLSCGEGTIKASLEAAVRWIEQRGDAPSFDDVRAGQARSRADIIAWAEQKLLTTSDPRERERLLEIAGMPISPPR